MTESEIQELVRRARDGSTAARNALITANLPLARRVAKRTASLYPDRPSYDGNLEAELVSAAVAAPHSGFLRAIELFDPSRGVAFATYLTPWLRDAMAAGLPSDFVRAGRAARRHGLIRRRAAALEAELGRAPTVPEIQACYRKWRPAADQIEAALQPARSIPYDSVTRDGDPVERAWQSDGMTEDDMIDALDRKRRVEMLRRALPGVPGGEAAVTATRRGERVAAGVVEDLAVAVAEGRARAAQR